MIEGIQGEGGVTPATAGISARTAAIMRRKELLLFMDEVQCGHFRSGRFCQSYPANPGECPWRQEVFAGRRFDGEVARAADIRSGAFWARAPYADLLSGGFAWDNVLAARHWAAQWRLRVWKSSNDEKLDDNARETGAHFSGWACWKLMTEISGHDQRLCAELGLMIGMELGAKHPGALRRGQRRPRCEIHRLLYAAGLVAIPAGTQITPVPSRRSILRRGEAEERLKIVESVVEKLVS